MMLPSMVDYSLIGMILNLTFGGTIIFLVFYGAIMFALLCFAFLVLSEFFVVSKENESNL